MLDGETTSTATTTTAFPSASASSSTSASVSDIVMLTHAPAAAVSHKQEQHVHHDMNNTAINASDVDTASKISSMADNASKERLPSSTTSSRQQQQQQQQHQMYDGYYMMPSKSRSSDSSGGGYMPGNVKSFVPASYNCTIPYQLQQQSGIINGGGMGMENGYGKGNKRPRAKDRGRGNGISSIGIGNGSGGNRRPAMSRGGMHSSQQHPPVYYAQSPMYYSQTAIQGMQADQYHHGYVDLSYMLWLQQQHYQQQQQQYQLQQQQLHYQQQIQPVLVSSTSSKSDEAERGQPDLAKTVENTPIVAEKNGTLSSPVVDNIDISDVSVICKHPSSSLSDCSLSAPNDSPATVTSMTNASPIVYFGELQFGRLSLELLNKLKKESPRRRTVSMPEDDWLPDNWPGEDEVIRPSLVIDTKPPIISLTNAPAVSMPMSYADRAAVAVSSVPSTPTVKSSHTSKPTQLSRSNLPSVQAPPIEHLPSTLVPSKKLSSEDTRLAEQLRLLSLDYARNFLLVPRGLTNRGQLCYTHCVLQALIACRPFFSLLEQLEMLDCPLLESSVSFNLLGALVRFSKEFRKVPLNTIDSAALENIRKSTQLENDGEFIPDFVYSALCSSSTFAGGVSGRQEDAEEFLTFLLDGMHEEFVAAVRAFGPMAETMSLTKADSMSTNDEWEEVGIRKKTTSITRTTQFDRSPISEMFGGRFRSTVRAAGRGTKDSVTLEPFRLLQVQILAKSISSVDSGLRALLSSEPLDGDDGKTKHVTLEVLPPTLVIQLKRFSFKEGRAEKITKNVSYSANLDLPLNVLSPLAQRNLTSDDGHRYRLFAVIFHSGRDLASGHYVSEVLHSSGGLTKGADGCGGRWLRFNDADVSLVNQSDFASDQRCRDAYLLFYQRKDLFINSSHTLS